MNHSEWLDAVTPLVRALRYVAVVAGDMITGNRTSESRDHHFRVFTNSAGNITRPCTANKNENGEADSWYDIPKGTDRERQPLTPAMLDRHVSNIKRLLWDPENEGEAKKTQLVAARSILVEEWKKDALAEIKALASTGYTGEACIPALRLDSLSVVLRPESAKPYHAFLYETKGIHPDTIEDAVGADVVTIKTYFEWFKTKPIVGIQKVEAVI